MELFLDNLVFTIQHTGGVSVYWYELLRGLCAAQLPVRFLNAGMNAENIFEQRLNYSAYPCVRESWIPSACLRYLPLRYKLPRAALFHGGYLRVSPQQDVVNILTIHDLAHERKLATRFPRVLVNQQQKRYGIRRADGIICISESTRRELLHFYPDTDPARVCVVHHGIADTFFPLAEEQPTEAPYVLYVGGRRQYKNFDLAVATVRQLPAQYTLVVVGGEQWSMQELQGLKHLLGGRFRVVPRASPQELNRLYNQAWCLLYPSAYEGFGFPPGEAMKAGCPVVAARTTSLPEVVGDAGLLVDEISPGAFATEILRLEQPAFRQQLVRDGLARVGLFTWGKSVQATIGFYQQCWHHKFSS